MAFSFMVGLILRFLTFSIYFTLKTFLLAFYFKFLNWTGLFKKSLLSILFWQLNCNYCPARNFQMLFAQAVHLQVLL